MVLASYLTLRGSSYSHQACALDLRFDPTREIPLDSEEREQVARIGGLDGSTPMAVDDNFSMRLACASAPSVAV